MPFRTLFGHGPTLALLSTAFVPAERRHRHGRGVPERSATRLLKVVAKDANQLVLIARKVLGIKLNAIAETPEAYLILRQQV